MVATWLLELYMDQINRALLEEPPSPPEALPGQTGNEHHANGDVSNGRLPVSG